MGSIMGMRGHSIVMIRRVPDRNVSFDSALLCAPALYRQAGSLPDRRGNSQSYNRRFGDDVATRPWKDWSNELADKLAEDRGLHMNKGRRVLQRVACNPFASMICYLLPDLYSAGEVE